MTERFYCYAVADRFYRAACLLGPFATQVDAELELSRAKALAYQVHITRGVVVQRSEERAVESTMFDLHELPIAWENPPGPRWTVYRDGGVYELLAGSMLDALQLAVPESKRPGVYFNTPPEWVVAIRSVEWTPNVEPIATAESPPVRIDETVGMRRVVFKRRRLIVDDTPRTKPPTLKTAIAELEQTVAWVGWCAAWAKESTPVAVQRFKSGERKGRIKWAPKTTATIKRAIVETNAVADAARATLDESATLVSRAGEVLVGAVYRTCSTIETLDEPTAEKLRATLEKLRAYVEPLTVYGAPLHGDSTLDAIDSVLLLLRGRLDCLTSVRELGFGVDAIAWLLPAKWDDIQCRRRVRVLEIEVRRDVHYAGVHVPIEHRRVVQVIDPKDWQSHESKGILYAPVERLTPITAEGT
jgi:hypothetical protein